MPFSGSSPRVVRCNNIRYPGDINSSDAANAERARHSILLLKNKVSSQAKHIHLLQRRNRRLQKKIKSLSDLLQHLKSKNLISEDAEQYILGTLP